MLASVASRSSGLIPLITEQLQDQSSSCSVVTTRMPGLMPVGSSLLNTLSPNQVLQMGGLGCFWSPGVESALPIPQP